MKTPGHSEESPSPIWNPPQLCDHPPERLNFTGHFPPDAPADSVFHVACNWCGTSWTQHDADAPWEALMERFAAGDYGVVSFETDDIASKVKWNRVTGVGNPILDSEVELKPFD